MRRKSFPKLTQNSSYHLQYDQTRPIKKGDTVYYYDTRYQRWLKVKIISKPTIRGREENRHYYNIRYLDTDRADDGLYLKPDKFWSFQLPQPIPGSSEESKEEQRQQAGPADPDSDIDHEEGNIQESAQGAQPNLSPHHYNDEITPPIPEIERGHTHRPRSRQVSPALYSHRELPIRVVQLLPQSEQLGDLSPNTKK